MVRICLGICKSIIFFLFILIFISFSYCIVYGGVAIPPKDLMYKHHPDYKSPDLDPDDPAAKQEPPPKIYYYKKGAISEYYQRNSKYTSNKNYLQDFPKNDFTSPEVKNLPNSQYSISKSNSKKYNYYYLIVFLIMLMVVGYGWMISYKRQKELQTTPVYEKYSTKPRRKRETIFDRIR